MSKKVTLLVAGSWGTALASVLADNGHDVFVWTRSEQQAAEINLQHTNSRYLPGITLSDRIVASSDMEEAVKGTSAIIIVAPSSAMRTVVQQLKPHYTKGTLIIHATKGFELPSLKRMSAVIAEELIPPKAILLSCQGQVMPKKW